MFQFLCGGFLFLGIFAHAQSSVGFIENKGQWSSETDFVSRIPGGKMVVGAGSFKYFFLDKAKLESLHHQSHEPDGASQLDARIRGHAVFATFVGADLNSSPEPMGRSSEYYNYFL